MGFFKKMLGVDQEGRRRFAIEDAEHNIRIVRRNGGDVIQMFSEVVSLPGDAADPAALLDRLNAYRSAYCRKRGVDYNTDGDGAE